LDGEEDQTEEFVQQISRRTRRSRNNALLDRQIDECLDESCEGGGGSSAAIGELVGNAGLAEISGEVQVRPVERVCILCRERLCWLNGCSGVIAPRVWVRIR